jgi:predicted HTH domain antitoxin
MVRQYVQVTDEQRMELIRLIHQENHSIAKASKLADIPYDNAKAINRTYLKERRVSKINYRLRYHHHHISSAAGIGFTGF